MEMETKIIVIKNAENPKKRLLCVTLLIATPELPYHAPVRLILIFRFRDEIQKE